MFGKQYDTYWYGDDRGNKGVFHHLRAITSDRGCIVHWLEAQIIDGKADAAAPHVPELGETVLMPPNWWDWAGQADQSNFDMKKIRAFIAKTDFVRMSIFSFVAPLSFRKSPAR